MLALAPSYAQANWDAAGRPGLPGAAQGGCLPGRTRPAGVAQGGRMMGTWILRVPSRRPCRLLRSLPVHRGQAGHAAAVGAAHVLHWSYDPDVVQRLLPGGLTVDTFGGAAWVGLVPFFMRVHAGRSRRPLGLGLLRDQRARLHRRPRGTALVPVARRRALRRGRGGPGQLPAPVLLVLHADRPGPLTAQSRTGDQEIAYSCQRRLPGPRTATSQVRVRIGTPYEPSELGTGTIS